jgi:hypothetical protein
MTDDESALVSLIAAVRLRIGDLVDLPPTPDNLQDLMLLFEQLARLEQIERDEPAWALATGQTRH